VDRQPGVVYEFSFSFISGRYRGNQFADYIAYDSPTYTQICDFQLTDVFADNDAPISEPQQAGKSSSFDIKMFNIDSSGICVFKTVPYETDR